MSEMLPISESCISGMDQKRSWTHSLNTSTWFMTASNSQLRGPGLKLVFWTLVYILKMVESGLIYIVSQQTAIKIYSSLLPTINTVRTVYPTDNYSD